MTNGEIASILIFSVLSFLAGRISKNFRKKNINYSIPTNFFKGIDFLLNNKENEALKEFINAAKINSRNAEVYISLGNLYRKRGEVEKSIRIHRAVLVQEDINKEVKKSTLINLARDFRKAGFYQRALNVLKEYEVLDKRDLNVLYEKIKIFSLSNQFEELLNLYKKNFNKLDKQNVINLSALYAKFAKDYIKNRNFFRANLYLKKGLKLYENNYLAYIISGDYYLLKKNLKKAKEVYIKAININPFTILKIRTKLNRVKTDISEIKKKHFLIECLHIRKLILENRISDAKDLTVKLILENPAIYFLHKLLFILELIEKKEFSKIKKNRNILKFSFKCNICNSIVKNFYYQCPFCKNWLTFQLKE